MIVTNLEDLKQTDREVHCPTGGFISYRFLLESDNMGFTLTRTVIPANGIQHWHYTKHLEACYCISGMGILRDIKTNRIYTVYPNVMYALDKNDAHEFEAIGEEVVLLCVFNPALKGKEVHKDDGSYDS